MSNRQRKVAKRARRRHSTPPSARASNRVFPPLPDWLSAELRDGSLGQLEAEWRDAARHRDHVRAVEALEALVAHPDVDEVLYVPELWSELAERYRALGRFDAAVEAVWAALDAGWNGAPDGRCDIARYLVQAGRPMQADAVYAAVRVDTPEDTWLYNVAGIEWSFAHDPLRALTWLTEGIELAIAGADPNGIVAQMSAQRRRCLTALGSHLDDLEHRVDTFLESGNAAKRYRPGLRATKPDRIDRSLLAYPWIPAHAWQDARRLWPHPASDHVNYDAYRRSLQREFLDASRCDRWTIRVAPLEPGRYTSWCAEHGHNPEAPTSPSHYAADLARTGDGATWPPAPGDPCWCGSHATYAECCARVSAQPAEATFDPPPILAS